MNFNIWGSLSLFLCYQGIFWLLSSWPHLFFLTFSYSCPSVSVRGLFSGSPSDVKIHRYLSIWNEVQCTLYSPRFCIHGQGRPTVFRSNHFKIFYFWFFNFSFSLWFTTEYWIWFPMPYNRTLLFIHSTYSLRVLIPSSLSKPSPTTQQPQICSLGLWVCFCFIDKFILDSTYKQYHKVFVFLFLIYFT